MVKQPYPNSTALPLLEIDKGAKPESELAELFQLIHRGNRVGFTPGHPARRPSQRDPRRCRLAVRQCQPVAGVGAGVGLVALIPMILVGWRRQRLLLWRAAG